jgi:SNF2 family DNA or RNA helicase
LGTKEDPLQLDDDELFDNHNAISEDEESEDETQAAATAVEEDKFFFGSVFEKVEEFDQHLDDPNPWHPHLARPLFPAQIIGFRWMASRHAKGGGLIGDKVGCGKVLPLEDDSI